MQLAAYEVEGGVRVPALITPPGLGRPGSALRIVALTGTRFLASVALRQSTATGAYTAPDAEAVALDDSDKLLARLVCCDGGEFADPEPLTAEQIAPLVAAADKALSPKVMSLLLVATATHAILGERVPAAKVPALMRTLVTAHSGNKAVQLSLVLVIAAAWRRARDTIRHALCTAGDEAAAERDEVCDAAANATSWIAKFVRDMTVAADGATPTLRDFFARACSDKTIMMPPGLRVVLAVLACDRQADSIHGLAAWSDALYRAAAVLPEWWRRPVCTALAEGLDKGDVTRRAACADAIGAVPPCSVREAMEALAAEGAGDGTTVIVAAGPCRTVLATRLRLSDDGYTAAPSAGGVCHVSLGLQRSTDPQAADYPMMDVVVRAELAVDGSGSGTDRLPVSCHVTCMAAMAHPAFVEDIVALSTQWAHVGAGNADRDSMWGYGKKLLLDWSGADAVARTVDLEGHRGAADAASCVIVALRIECGDFESDLE